MQPSLALRVSVRGNGPAGCEACAGTGYRGRVLLAELLTMTSALRQAILEKGDTDALEAAADQPGRRTMRMVAEDAVAGRQTSVQEIERVLGPAKSEVGSQRSEVGGRKSEVRGQRSEVGRRSGHFVGLSASGNRFARV